MTDYQMLALAGIAVIGYITDKAIKRHYDLKNYRLIKQINEKCKKLADLVDNDILIEPKE